VLPLLSPRPFTLPLGPHIASVGFAVDDHRSIIDALANLSFHGEPERAVDKRRAEFLAGRLAAVHALLALGISAQPGRNADGSPSWPDAVVGSITHGAQRALCAVALKAEVGSLGVDAETLMGQGASRELRRRICSERELKVLGEGLGAPEHHLVSLAFSAKESLYKCLFPRVGRFMDFGAAEVVAARHRPLADGMHGELELRLTVSWSERFQAGTTLESRFFMGREHVETLVALAADE